MLLRSEEGHTFKCDCCDASLVDRSLAMIAEKKKRYRDFCNVPWGLISLRPIGGGSLDALIVPLSLASYKKQKILLQAPAEQPSKKR